MRVAALDVGSNSVRLLVAEARGQRVRSVVSVGETTRLAAGFGDSMGLGSHAVARTVVAAKRMVVEARRYRVHRIRAVATGVVRESPDGDSLLELIHSAAGLRVEVLSAEEEGRLCLLGACRSIAGGCEAVRLVDVGGGSTELVAGTPFDVRAVHSFPLGCVTVTERFLRSDPPAAEELRAASGDLRNRLARLHLRSGPGSIIATGGTATSLAAVMLSLAPYSPERVQGYRLDRDRLESLTAELTAMPLWQREELPGLSADRAEIIGGGAVILSNVLECWGGDSYVVSDRGLRHGIVTELLRPANGRGAGPDRAEPRRTGADECP